MELIQVGARTYYIPNATNIGVYQVDSEHVYLIDSGSDKDAGKKILKLLESEGLQVRGIVSTHSNADHIGGNQLIQNRTGCEILANGIEKASRKHRFWSRLFCTAAFLFGNCATNFCAQSLPM